MLKENEYLGFAMRFPQRGMSVYFFQMSPDGLKLYGPFKFDGKVNEHQDPHEAVIVTGMFADGTQPIALAEFHERTAAGETWNNGSYNIFTKLLFVGKARLKNKNGDFIVLHELMEADPEGFFLTMFSEAIGLLAWNFEVIDKKAKRMKKARALFEENIQPMKELFSDKDIFEFYKDAGGRGQGRQTLRVTLAPHSKPGRPRQAHQPAEVHLVEPIHGQNFGPAACGSTPKGRSYGWTEEPGATVTCPRCLALTATHEELEARPEMLDAMRAKDLRALADRLGYPLRGGLEEMRHSLRQLAASRRVWNGISGTQSR